MIRAKRQIEFQYSDHDIIPKFKRDADFVEYFKTLGKSKGASSTLWEATLNHLRTFTGGKLAFKNIDERWLEKWQNYLLDKVSRNSAHTYQATIIAGLNRAYYVALPSHFLIRTLLQLNTRTRKSEQASCYKPLSFS